MAIGDVDPSYSLLRYVADRFELNMEQRHWLAFLYSTCYSGPTVFYIYNEFPDFENVDFGRLDRWWKENRAKLMFQTDRKYIKNNNQFVECARSYSNQILCRSQVQTYATLNTGDAFQTYRQAYKHFSEVKYLGRFSLFLYLEAVKVVTGFPMEPTDMDIITAEACLRGMTFVAKDRGIFFNSPQSTRRFFDDLQKEMKAINPAWGLWNIETTLCAYGKYRVGKRWIGYYISRQGEEIESMERAITTGVDWSVLWEYRQATFQKRWLLENRGTAKTEP